MIRVAISGGANGLGKSIAESIHASNKHECIILSRHESTSSNTIKVDYSDVDGLRHILEQKNIHVVISTIGVYTEAHYNSQLNLIKAAELSKKTTRFIPSEFGIHAKPEHVNRSPSFPFKIRTIEYLEQSSLQYTLVHTGLFLDYLAWPVIPSYLEVQSLFVNLRCKAAVIPGSGNKHIALTHTRDVAEFVIALLDLADWEKRYNAFAERITINELVRTAEEIMGTKFDRKYDSKEELEQGRCSLLPPPLEEEFQDTRFDQLEAYVAYMAKLGSIIEDGIADLGTDTDLLKVHNELTPLTVREAILRWIDSEKSQS